MSQPWSPEYELTCEEAKFIIEKQFPKLKPVRIFEIGKGFDNTVFQVNSQYIFRFPRKELAVSLLQTENRLLPLLVNKLPIQIPYPIFFGEPTEAYKWPFTGYLQVSGQAPGVMVGEVRDKSATRLADFFKKLHQFPIEKAKELNIPHDRFERMNLKRRIPMLIENLKKAADLQLLPDAEAAFNWVQSLGDFQIGDAPLTLVHGDCHIRNILVNEEGVISGIIDWGDTHLGNPAIDLSLAFSFLTPSGREVFFQTYGNVEEITKLAAKFFALYVSVILLLYGNDLRDDQLVANAKESLRLIFE
jgi:aminoglycoside phosphotransferase (APT) family kinase protein